MLSGERMRKLNFLVICLGLILGLGYNIFISYFFWRAYLTESYYWVFYVYRFNEFWLEFIFFNFSIAIIFTAIILLISIEASNGAK